MIRSIAFISAYAIAALGSTQVVAQTVDGVGAPGEYAGGTLKTVNTNPAAPTSNFGTPTNEATAGYTIALKDQGGSLYGLLTQTGGTSNGSFANLYFDLNPNVGDGSDLGFELGVNVATAFIPGRNGQPGFSVALDPSVFSTAAGTGTFEFSLKNFLFTAPIAGLIYYPGQTFETTQTLRLSQSLGYSVAGGSSYGPDRLGAFSVATPEPATWAMMIAGFGAIGFAMRAAKRRAHRDVGTRDTSTAEGAPA